MRAVLDIAHYVFTCSPHSKRAVLYREGEPPLKQIE
jgi:hypothetical protein